VATKHKKKALQKNQPTPFPDSTKLAYALIANQRNSSSRCKLSYSILFLPSPIAEIDSG
jgi:hypothetical protein